MLFGGYDGSVLGETWEYDGSTWVKLTPTTSPPARYDASMVYDPVHGVTVLFGGYSSAAFADTWTWNGTNWTDVTPSSGSPSARRGHGMTWDSARTRVVLFGGSSSTSTYLADTWEWFGSSWVQAAPAASPGGVWIQSLTYDPIRQRSTFYGGYTSAYLSATWDYSGTTWKQSTASGPGSLWGAGLAFDEKAGVVVLTGGYSGSTYQSASWQYDGTSWTSRDPLPGVRDGHLFVFDSVRKRLVMFGGAQASGVYLNDTWEY